MVKFFIKIIFLIISILFAGLVYLSVFGINTDKFNDLISNEIKKENKELQFQFKKIYLKFDILKLSIKINAKDSKILFKNKAIEILNISTNLSVLSYFNKDYSIKNLTINTKENEIKDLLKFTRLFVNNLQITIFENLVNRGSLKADIKVNFDKNGKIKDNYSIIGKIKNAEINLLNKNILTKINFDFEIKNKFQKVQNVNFKINDLAIGADKVVLEKQKENYIIKGVIKSTKGKLNKNIVDIFVNNEFKNIGLEDIEFSSKTEFLLKTKESLFKNNKLNKKFKIVNSNIISNVSIEEFEYILVSGNLSDFIDSYNNKIKFKNNELNITFKNNKIEINGNGEVSFDEKNYEKIVF